MCALEMCWYTNYTICCGEKLTIPPTISITVITVIITIFREHCEDSTPLFISSFILGKPQGNTFYQVNRPSLTALAITC